MKHASASWLVTVPFVLASPLSAQQGRTAASRDERGELERSSWFAEVSKELQAAEYRFSPVEGEGCVWSAPSRTQGFRSRVSAAGVELVPRDTGASETAAPWKLVLSTGRLGRAGNATELNPATVRVTGTRVELDHGSLTEWFENQPVGLEQGWTIRACPGGVEPLWIGLALAGDLSLRIDEGARSGRFVDASGALRLRYTGLVVLDATGRELEAHLRPSPTGLGIEVDDAGAVYPLTVDPVLTAPAWTAESNQTFSRFALSLAPAGDVNGDGFSDVIIGAQDFDNGQTDEGRTFVYHGSAAGLASAPAWTAESDQAGAKFGYVVGTAGDVNGDGFGDVIVGAQLWDQGVADAGGVWAYLGSPTGLASSAAFFFAIGAANTGIGSDVCTAGDINGDGLSDVIVGAPDFNGGVVGRFWVFLGSASGSPLVLTPPPRFAPQSGSAFASALSPAGDVNGDGYDDVIAGAPHFDGAFTDQGAAYVYFGSTSGLSFAPTWTTLGEHGGADFGGQVATAGDVNGDGYSDVLVASQNFGNGPNQEGKAYLYLGSASGPSTSPVWTREGNDLLRRYPNAMSSAGDVNGDGYGDVILGSVNTTFQLPGVAELFLGSPAGLATIPDWSQSDTQGGEWFGIAASTAGDVNADGYSDVLIGAPFYDNDQANEGRAFVYLGSAAGLTTSAAWMAEGDQAGVVFGASVASAGDVNGDGYGDVLVSDNLFDAGQTNEGRALLYLGSASGTATTPAWSAEGDQAFADFTSAASAGDVNGDGYGDVIVGAWLFDGDLVNEGRVSLFLGSPGGLSFASSWTAEGNQANSFFGSAVAGAGDVNGDGYGDVIVGAFGFDNGEPEEGRAFVFLGTSTGLATSPAWTSESDQSSAYFGYKVATAGDVNADGYSDVLVGAQFFDNGQTDEGRVHLFLGSPLGPAALPSWTAESNQADAKLGLSLSTAGDVNGDGYSDVIVGAPLYDNGQADEGRVSLYLGSASGLAATPAWSAESDQAGARLGMAVSTAGDVNADGYADVVAGADWFDNGEMDEGRATLFFGSASGLSASPSWTAESNQAQSGFAASLASAGDVNGDGYADVIVAAKLFDNGLSNAGRVFVYLGNDGRGGLVRTLQQRTPDDVRPLALLGMTAHNGVFRIRAQFPKNLRTFSWADPVVPSALLEWEVKPLGVPFDGTDIQRSPEQALEPAGGNLVFNELTAARDLYFTHPRTRAFVIQERSYHWRARIATGNPLFPHTAWFGLAGNTLSEAKLRRPWL